MRYRSTKPSRYYERQSPAKLPVVMEYKQPFDGEVIAAIIGLGVCGFAAGMILAATWAGVL